MIMERGVLFIAWQQSILDEKKSGQWNKNEKTTSKEEATYFSPQWMILDSMILDVFFLFVFFFFLRVDCSRARTGLRIALFSDNAWETFVLCSDEKKRCVAVGGGIFNWCCKRVWRGNWPDVCMNVCMNSSIVNIITRKPDGGNPIM